MSVPGKCILSGGLVLSTGKDVRVRVELTCPSLTRAEEREVEQVRIALHDLTPIQVPKSRPSKPRKAAVAKKVRGPTLQTVLVDINRTMPVMEAQVNASLFEAARARDELLRKSREVAIRLPRGRREEGR